MKKLTLLLAIFAAAIASTALRANSDTRPMSGFDRMKTLVGTWSGEEGGNTMTSTIRLVSNGTAIEEVFQGGESHQMVTLYSRDGADKLAMIHLCEMGNQPRMETGSLAADATTFDFSFTGGTNMGPADPHMDHMTIHVIDNDHFDENWTARQNGKDVKTALFHFTRMPSAKATPAGE